MKTKISRQSALGTKPWWLMEIYKYVDWHLLKISPINCRVCTNKRLWVDCQIAIWSSASCGPTVPEQSSSFYSLHRSSQELLKKINKSLHSLQENMGHYSHKYARDTDVSLVTGWSQGKPCANLPTQEERPLGFVFWEAKFCRCSSFSDVILPCLMFRDMLLKQ